MLHQIKVIASGLFGGRRKDSHWLRRLVWGMCIIAASTGAFAAGGETTVTLGEGTSASATRGPFQRSDSGSDSVYSRANLVYTAAELSAAGMSAGASISQLNWDLGSENTITGMGDAYLKIYVRNSSATEATSDLWANMISGSTLVTDQTYNTTNNFPGAKGWVPFAFTTPFTYTGGTLEIAVDWDMSRVIPADASAPNLLLSGNGSLNWRWDATEDHNSVVYRSGSSSSPSDINKDPKAERVNTQFVFTAGSDSSAPTVTISGAPLAVDTTATFTVTFTFNKKVIGFDLADITVSKGNVSDLATTDDGITYTANITPTETGGTGDITIDVAANVAEDASGNKNTAATQVKVIYVLDGSSIIPSYITDGSLFELEGETPHPLINRATALRFLPLEAQVATTNGNGWRQEYKIDQPHRLPMGATYEKFEATYTVDMSNGAKSIIAQHHGDDPTLMKLYYADSTEHGVGGDGVFDLYVRLRDKDLNGDESVHHLGTFVAGDSFNVFMENDYGEVTVSATPANSDGTPTGETKSSAKVRVSETPTDYFKFGNYLQSQVTTDTEHAYGGVKCSAMEPPLGFKECYEFLGITKSVVTLTNVSYERIVDATYELPPPDPNSELLNGDFEDSTSLKEWTQEEPVSNSNDTHTGEKSAKITAAPGRLYQRVEVTPNTNYELSVYVKGEGAMGVKGTERIDDTAGAGQIDLSETFDASDWTLVSISFTTGADPLPVYVYGLHGSSGDVRFDDFSLKPIDDSDTASTNDEVNAPNAGDANGDGIPDANQNNVASFSATSPGADGSSGSNIEGVYYSIKVDTDSGNTQGEGCGIVGGTGSATEAALGNDPDYDYPAGLLKFTLDTCEQAEVVLYFHGLTSAPTAVRKYSPTSNTWYDMPGATIEAVTINGATVYKTSYVIADGGTGDDDGQDNGTIVDPVGLALLVAVNGGTGAGTGAQNIPVFGPFGLLAMLIGLFWLGGSRRKKA